VMILYGRFSLSDKQGRFGETEAHNGTSVSMWQIHPEDGGNKVLRNVGILPQRHTASQPRRTGFDT
jgi:hypothetical protein